MSALAGYTKESCRALPVRECAIPKITDRVVCNHIMVHRQALHMDPTLVIEAETIVEAEISVTDDRDSS